ncbi:11624_t:CDS:2, partial [Gigaspora rosea]
SSSLDNTQAQSLVHSLCREIALIEGPPGTGKTFVGVEIMKNLLKVGIEKIVRLGGRSKSEIIKNFTLEEMYKKNESSIFRGDTHWDNINDYLLVEYPDHWERFRNTDIPDFIFETDDSEEEDLFETNDNKS